MGFHHLNKLTKQGIVGHVHGNEVDDTAISSNSSEVSSVVSFDSDLMDSDDENSSASSSSSPPSSSDSPAAGSLLDMSSLMQSLPLKRGLSMYFEGKSQSFTSLSTVMSLEDLAKPENPYNKRMKSCKSYAGLAAESHFSSSRSSSSYLRRTASSSRFISKKTSPFSSRVFCSSLSGKRSSSSFVGVNRPPIAPPQSSSSTRPLYLLDVAN